MPDRIYHATREKSYHTKIQCIPWTTLICGVLALLLTLFSNFWCRYASTMATVTSKENGNSFSFPVYHGIWNYQYTDLSYGSQEGQSLYYKYNACAVNGLNPSWSTWNTALNIARAFSIVAVMLGVVAIFLSCVAFHSLKFWFCVSIMFLLTCISQGLTFLYFRSSVCNGFGEPPQAYQQDSGSSTISLEFDEYCRLAIAAKVGIAATALWFIGGLAALVATCSGRRHFEGEPY